MTYGDLVEKRRKLNSVNFMAGADRTFIYAVGRNKDKMDSIIRVLDKMLLPSDDYKEYQKNLDILNRKYALKEEDSTVAFVTINTRQGIQRGFKKLIGEGNDESPYEKDLAALKNKFAAAIKEQETKEAKYDERLLDEILDDDYRIFFIDSDKIPDGLHPIGMEGCMHFIREPESQPVKEIPKKTSKK